MTRAAPGPDLGFPPEYRCRTALFAKACDWTARRPHAEGAARFGAADFAPTAREDRYSQNERPKRLLSVTTKQPFPSVVSDHGATVLRVCRVIVGPVDADDAWSETFLSALKAYPDLPAEANVEAWLVTIAHRKAVDIIRHRSRHAVPTDDIPDRPIHPPDVDDRCDLTDALNRLSPKQKQAVAYHYLAGLPYAEVGAVIGSSPEAARRSASDGIAALRRTFASTPATPGTKGQHS